MELVRCSSCHQALRRLDLGNFDNIPALNQWMGNVCPACGRVYCGSCLVLGGPTPCPSCGTPTKPAQRINLEPAGAIERATSAPPAIHAAVGAIPHAAFAPANGAPVHEPSAWRARRALPPREVRIGAAFLIASLAAFGVGVPLIVAGRDALAMPVLGISYLAGGIGAGYIAAKRGRSMLWALLGFFSWLGVVVAFLLPNRTRTSRG